MADMPRTRELALPASQADLDALRRWVTRISEVAASVQVFRVTPIYDGNAAGRPTFHSTNSLMDHVGPRGDATRLIIDCLGAA
jgi:hypothetical protein